MNAKLKPTPLAPLATPSDIPEVGCKAIAMAVNPLVADAFALYVKTKNFHWHMTGAHYRDYHLLLDEQATEIFNMIDILAERVRKLGQPTLHSIGEIAKLQAIRDDNDIYVEPNEIMFRLMEDNKKFTRRMREAHAVCEEYNDIATTSLLENFIDESEKRTWFLYETHLG